MKSEKVSFSLALNLGFAYTMYVIGKVSFGAAKAGLIEAGVLTKTETGSINGIFWLVYAAGQIVGLFVVNKISPYLLIKIALIGSAASNIAMACTENFTVMLIAWCLGGAFQFGLWPALLKLTAEDVGEPYRERLTKYLAYAYSIATVISYFLCAWMLSVLSWRYIFIISGIVCGVALPGIVYVQRKVASILQRPIGLQTVSKQKKEKLTGKIAWDRALVFFALLMCLQSVVTNGVSGWASTILLELYSIPANTSSLLGIVQTCVSFLGIAIGIFVYDRMKNDELRSLLVVYLPLILIMVLLNNIANYNVYITTTLLYSSSVFLSAAGARLSLNYPARYRDIGHTATVGAVINCMSTGGMAIANYGGGYIADHFGWKAVIHMWNIMVILFVMVVICIFPLWARFKQSWGLKRY